METAQTARSAMVNLSRLTRDGRYITAAVVLVIAVSVSAQQPSQVADPDFISQVVAPAYTADGPRVAIDAGHLNFHTAESRYLPFAALLRRDGYQVTTLRDRFTEKSLAAVDVLVVANALAADAQPALSSSAFSGDECDAVRAWVSAGGALLLVADHAPFGSAAAALAARFGVDLGKGYVIDRNQSRDRPTWLLIRRGAGLLDNHPIAEGRSPVERLVEVIAFTGQSVSVPTGAAPVLSLSSTAVEVETADAVARHLKDGSGPSRQVNDRAALIAMPFGKGRVVVAGEAAMFTAQVLRSATGNETRVGMNTPGIDNQQLTLNVLHWLSGALPVAARE